MFLGEHQHSVDSKGRIVMPRAFREEITGEVVITRGRDRNLVIHKLADWEEVADKLRASTPDTRAGRAQERNYFATSEKQVVAQNTGRINLIGHLRDYAGIDLEAEVVVVGNFETVEVWNPERYAQQKALGEKEYLSDEEDDPDEL